MIKPDPDSTDCRLNVSLMAPQPAPVPQAPQFLNNNSAHQLPLPLPQQHQPQQDFVLFDSHRIPPQRPSVSTALAIDGSRRSSHQIQSASPSQQNRSLANLFQSTGHSTNNTTAYSNGFPSAQQQFYASSAPASSPSLQQQRPRPQVPLFSQASGNNAQQTSNNMTMQGTHPASATAVPHDSLPATDMDLYDDFTAFEGGAPAKSYSSAYSSPAVPTIYDPAVNLSSSNSTMGTVSPQDLLRNDPFTPAPNSAAMTNLTSPSTYNESPQYDGLEISPFGNDRELDSAVDANPWFPLFPQEDQMDSKAQDSPLEPEEKLQVSEHLRSSSTVNRLRAGSAASPPSGTHASISGVSSRRRDKPLPPIVVADVNDTVAMKRARNTLAARKSRQRKSQRFDELEERISELEKDRDHWKSIALQRTGGQQ